MRIYSKLFGGDFLKALFKSAFVSALIYAIFYVFVRVLGYSQQMTALFAGQFVVFVILLAILPFAISIPILVGMADKKIDEEGGRRSNFHSTLLTLVREMFSGACGLVLVTIALFIASCHAWATFEPRAFVKQPTTASINVFVADLILHGYAEKLTGIVAAKPKTNAVWLNYHAMIFKYFITLVGIAVIAKVIRVWRDIHTLRENKETFRRIMRQR